MTHDRKYHVWLFNDADQYGPHVGISDRDMDALKQEAARQRSLESNEKTVAAAEMLLQQTGPAFPGNAATARASRPTSAVRPDVTAEEVTSGPGPMDIDEDDGSEVQARKIGRMALEKGFDSREQLLQRVESILQARTFPFACGVFL